MKLFCLKILFLDLMLQNVIMADHRQINKSDFRGNFFRRRTYDNPRNYLLSPDSTCSYDNQCSGYPLAICDTVCKCVRGALNTGATCISSSSALQSSISCPAGQTYIREAGVCMTVQQPGEPCQYSQQCSALEPGAYCLKMRCECVYGMKKSSNGCTFVNNDCKERGHIFISEIGECREVIPPGGRGCSHNLQCSGAYPDATCFMQTCTCPPNLPVAADGTCGRSCSDGYVYSGVTGECLPEVQPGEPCLYSSQCQAVYGGMVCDKNTCRCPNGLVFDGSKCSSSCEPPHVIENDICVKSCSGENVNINGRCLPIVPIGHPCSGNDQCQSGSFCQNGSCRCPPGFNVINDQCEAVESEPNGSCLNNEKCTKGSVCYNGICTCPRNLVLTNGICQPKQAVPIGGDCSRIGVVCDGGSTCVSFKCVCPLGTTPRNGICVTHVTANPGESCRSGEECVENSACNEETMTCDCVSKTQMVIGKKCIERLRSHPGYGCSMGEMCIGNSVCIDGRCKCPEGKIERQKICIIPIKAKLGEMCGEGVICQEGSYCDKDSVKCSCPKGWREINGQCKQVTIVYPGELCTDVTSRCAGGSFCVRGRCECSMNMKVVNKKCVILKTAYPGESCNENSVCSSLSVCKNNICTCINDMIIRDRTCIQRRRVNIGESCDKYDICMGNSSCVDKYCQCPIGHVNNDNMCMQRKTVAPGFLCNPEDICTGQSICVRGVCQCKPNHKQMHNICVKNAEATEGNACASNEECGNGLDCINRVCSCPEGYFSSNGRCRSYIKLGQLCTSDDRCRDRQALCSRNICTCKDGFVNINGECINRIVTPAEPEVQSQMKSQKCVASNQCPSGANCVRGECKCKPGLGLSRLGFCIPINYADPGTSCSNGERCRSDSKCIDGICVCPDPFILKENKCVKTTRDQSRSIASVVTNCPRDGSCQPPNCFCSNSGKVPPRNLDVKNIPQMIMLTFDDPITDRIINTLKSLFSGKIRNPNGCPIKGTFFISHQWNNYDQSQWLFSKGNEIAVNSITREDLSDRTKERWIQEQRGMRDTLAEFSYVEKTQIIGARAPNFKLGGDKQFEMLRDNNFTFDNSMFVNGLYWPQTLDHKLAWECEGKCPKNVYKGVWEIPIQNIQANDGMWYTKMTQAIKPSDSRVSVKQMLMRNFLSNYKSNRAPFVLTLNTDFLTYLPDNGAIYALEDFLKEVVQKNDVYIVTGSQIIDWMKTPTETERLRTLRSWQCNFLMNDHIQPCESPSVCSYDSRNSGQLAYSFRICGSCPKKYPWI